MKVAVATAQHKNKNRKANPIKHSRNPLSHQDSVTSAHQEPAKSQPRAPHAQVATVNMAQMSQLSLLLDLVK